MYAYIYIYIYRKRKKGETEKVCKEEKNILGVEGKSGRRKSCTFKEKPWI